MDDAVRQIRERVGSDKVLLGLSGGVDSSVTAALLHSIGDQLTCVFVDNGLLRLHKASGDGHVRQQHGREGYPCRCRRSVPVQAQGRERSEQKRKIIGNTFIDVFDAEAAKIKDVNWLAQGTIYPDVIESAASKTGKAHVWRMSVYS